MKSVNRLSLLPLGLSAIFCLFAGAALYAAGGVVTGPNVVAPDRYVYYPGTETLGKAVRHSRWNSLTS